MTQELQDYYKQLRQTDYKINPFNMKMMNPTNAKKDLPLLLPHGPTSYKSKFNSLKQNTDIDLDEWKSNYINYNTYVTNKSLKEKQAKSYSTINKNRNSVQGLRNTLDNDIKDNDNVLFARIKTLEKLKKQLVNKKIEYDKLLHSANASGQFNKDKESQYTESTVRLILQIVGIVIAGGIVYKLNK
jgi:hypothetical protein